MKVLLTNHDLSRRGGSQLYVCDVAIRLLELGHTPIVYSPVLGQVAKQLRAATVPVVSDLNEIAAHPDIIHGQQLFETMAALLRFTDTPAVYFSHDWYTGAKGIPRFPRLLRYVAVDLTCRDRLIYENGIPENRITLALNFADMKRFRPRSALPARPQRALLLSNYAEADGHVGIVREACAAMNVSLDVIGERMGNSSSAPEEILSAYDVVFAKGRAAIEALAVGCAVHLLGVRHLGPLVTTKNFERLRPLNFGSRALCLPLGVETITAQLRNYDPADAAEVSRKIRATASRDQTVNQLIDIYQEVIDEYRLSSHRDLEAEAKATIDYLTYLHGRIDRSGGGRLETLRSAEKATSSKRLLKIPVLGKAGRFTMGLGKSLLTKWKAS